MSSIPQLVHVMTVALASTAEGLAELSHAIYDDNDHEYHEFHERYCDYLTQLGNAIEGLQSVSKGMDEQAGIMRTRVDPRLVRARAALRDIHRGKTDNPVERAAQGLQASQ